VDLPELKRNWDMFGATDPLWSIYTAPGKEGNRWDPAEFFETGELEIAGVMDRVEALDIDLAGGSALDFGCGVGRLTPVQPVRRGTRCGHRAVDDRSRERFQQARREMLLPP
jgi:hypothetical protein